MKKSNLFLIAAVTVAMISCTSKEQKFVETFTSCINEGKTSELNKIFPDAVEVDIDLKDCKIEIDPDSVGNGEKSFTFPATITRKGEKPVTVKFTAEQEGDSYVITDYDGIIPLSSKSAMAVVAKNTGAVNPNATDKEVLKFVGDDNNYVNLKSVLNSIKSSILDIYVEPIHNDGVQATYTITVVNNSSYTFPKSTAIFNYKIYYTLADAFINDKKSVTFKQIVPGKNTTILTITTDNVSFIIDGTPTFDKFTAITEADLDKALELYNYNGDEYKHFTGQ